MENRNSINAFINIYLIFSLYIILYYYRYEYNLVIFTTFIFNGNISIKKNIIQLLVYKSLLSISNKCNDIKLIIYLENITIDFIKNSKNVIIAKLPKLNIHKTPYFGPLLFNAIKKYKAKFYMYINGDIIISPQIRNIIHTLMKYINIRIIRANILCIATRSTIYSSINNISLYYNHYKLYKTGVKSGPYSQDVFIMTKMLYLYNFKIYNKLLVGRAGIDNIILGTALSNKNIDVIDASDSIAPIHLEDCKRCKKQFIDVL